MASDVPPTVAIDSADLSALLRYVRRLERDVGRGILVEGLARWQPRLQQISLNTSLGSPWEFEFGRVASRRADGQPSRCVACRIMVELLAHAHECSCEADFAAARVEPMEGGGVPDLAPLRARFAPIAARLPVVAALDRQLRRVGACDGSDSMRDNRSSRMSRASALYAPARARRPR
jgi:hypothetical protein